jgi:two-component system, LuxR family, response regulator FixJ
MSTEGHCVFVLDDDAAARKSVAALVESMNIPVHEFNSSEEFLALYHPDQRGCIVTDLRMRGASGIDLLKNLRAQGIRLPVIIISGYADVPVTVQAFQAGVWTLLQKPYRDQELWDAIRSALAYDEKLEAVDRQRSHTQAKLNRLTIEEKQVLSLILNGMPNKTVASRLNLGLRTVEARRHNIMSKMEIGSLVELAHLLNKVGLDEQFLQTAVTA